MKLATIVDKRSSRRNSLAERDASRILLALFSSKPPLAFLQKLPEVRVRFY